MSNQEQKHDIREQVLEAIKAGRVAMRPKWHFILRAALLVVGVGFVFLLLFYLASFMLFTLRVSGAWFAPAFGLRGWFILLRSVPWILLLAAVLFITILEVLVRRYAFAYRRPLLYSLFGIVLFAAVGGFLFHRIHVHGRVLQYVNEHSIPFAGRFYREFESGLPDEAQSGEILSIATSGFMIENQLGATFTIIVAPTTRLPYGAGFREGDSVVVIGDRTENIIQAFGVRAIPSDWDIQLFHRSGGTMRFYPHAR